MHNIHTHQWVVHIAHINAGMSKPVTLMRTAVTIFDTLNCKLLACHWGSFKHCILFANTSRQPFLSLGHVHDHVSADTSSSQQPRPAERARRESAQPPRRAQLIRRGTLKSPITAFTSTDFQLGYFIYITPVSTVDIWAPQLIYTVEPSDGA